jgi:hypothetical protein
MSVTGAVVLVRTPDRGNWTTTIGTGTYRGNDPVRVVDLTSLPPSVRHICHAPVDLGGSRGLQHLFGRQPCLHELAQLAAGRRLGECSDRSWTSGAAQMVALEIRLDKMPSYLTYRSCHYRT